MTAKEVIIKLIDTKAITGEEAVILLEALCTPKEIEKVIEKIPYWWYNNNHPTAIPTWTAPEYTITEYTKDYTNNLNNIKSK